MKMLGFLVCVLFSTVQTFGQMWQSYNPEGDYGDYSTVPGTNYEREDGSTVFPPICRGTDEEGVIHVGKVEDGLCLFATDVVDEEETERWSSLLRIAYSHGALEEFEILAVRDDWRPFLYWIEDSDIEENTLIFNAHPNHLVSGDRLYICRAVNRSNFVVERGIHSGQVYGVLGDDGACYYVYRTSRRRGQKAPDIYTWDFEVLAQRPSGVVIGR